MYESKHISIKILFIHRKYTFILLKIKHFAFNYKRIGNKNVKCYHKNKYMTQRNVKSVLRSVLSIIFLISVEHALVYHYGTYFDINEKRRSMFVVRFIHLFTPNI